MLRRWASSRRISVGDRTTWMDVGWDRIGSPGMIERIYLAEYQEAWNGLGRLEHVGLEHSAT